MSDTRSDETWEQRAFSMCEQRNDLRRRLDEAERRIQAALTIIDDWANDRDHVTLVTLPSRIDAALSDHTEGGNQ